MATATLESTTSASFQGSHSPIVGWPIARGPVGGPLDPSFTPAAPAWALPAEPIMGDYDEDDDDDDFFDDDTEEAGGEGAEEDDDFLDDEDEDKLDDDEGSDDDDDDL